MKVSEKKGLQVVVVMAIIRGELAYMEAVSSLNLKGEIVLRVCDSRLFFYRIFSWGLVLVCHSTVWQTPHTAFVINYCLSMLTEPRNSEIIQWKNPGIPDAV